MNTDPSICQESLSRTAFVLRIQQNCEIEEIFLQQLPQSAPSILTPMPQCPLGSASLRFLCDLPSPKFQKHPHSLFKCCSTACKLVHSMVETNNVGC